MLWKAKVLKYGSFKNDIFIAKFGLLEIDGVKYARIKVDNLWVDVRIDRVFYFTGLKDFDGKEIYQHDIVYNDKLGEGNVVFVKGCFMVEFENDTVPLYLVKCHLVDEKTKKLEAENGNKL